MNANDELRDPKWFSNWKILILFALLSFAFAFGLRALDLPKWTNPAFMVDGEYILGTHDAYAWLAGAKGVGRAANNPMAGLIRILGNVTGAQYGNIAFWLPAVFAGFTAMAAFAWGVFISGPWLGFCAGVFTTTIPVFYFRTRLSYYDTDLVTILFPLIISLLLAGWLSKGIRSHWIRQKNEMTLFQPTMQYYFLPVFAGVCVHFGQLWHGDVLSFGIYSLFASIFLVLAVGNKRNRAVLLEGLTYFCLSSMLGWIGTALAVAMILLSSKTEAKKYHIFENVFFYLFIILIVFALSDAGLKLVNLLAKVQSYLKPVSDIAQESVSQIHYPGIGQSVIEAQNISLKSLLSDLTGNTALSCFGLVGFLFLLIKRPAGLLLLPFAVMSLAAVKMGGRFAMFGGIVTGLGGSFFLYWFLVRFITFGKKENFCASIASVSLIIFLVFTDFPAYKNALPTPIISQEHAKALKAMSNIAPDNSTFWTWWDWGYATMYFTGKKSFADGSNHGGTTLFPLAFAFTTPSMQQANQFIKYSASKDGVPSNAWGKMKAEDVVKLIYSFGSKDYGFKNRPKQYIVTSWSDVRLAYWILYYGSCNLLTGQGVHPNISTLSTAFNLDKENGRIHFVGGQTVPLSGYDVVSQRVCESKMFPNSAGPYLLFNQHVDQGYLVDDMVRQSLLSKLMLINPASPEVKNRFKLVYEGFPMVRVYEVI